MNYIQTVDDMTKGSLWVVTAESIGPSRTPKGTLILLTHDPKFWDQYGNIPCMFFGEKDRFDLISQNWLSYNAQKIV